MESGPVFADSSGRRRRVLRYAGLGFAVVMAVCLGAVVVAMTGGPQAPLTHWAVQQPPQAGATGHAQHAAAHGSAAGQPGGSQAPGAGAQPGQASSPAEPSQGGSARPSVSSSPSPSASASPSAGASATATPSATPTGSPTPTNRAGKTPPGHTKSPNPHKSVRVT